ncbi:unnamed protein product, partial [Didymodactylos carnosus]
LTTTVASSSSSCSTSTLLLLPNELILFIFLYLQPTEIIEIFFNLSTRINNLIFSDKHVNEIDLTHVDQVWLDKYLSFIQPCTNKLKFKQKQLSILFGQPSSLSQNIRSLYPKLHTLIFTEIDADYVNDIRTYIEQFKTLYQSTLILKFKTSIPSQLYIQLFQHNTYLETIHIDTSFWWIMDDASFSSITQNFHIKNLRLLITQFSLTLEYLSLNIGCNEDIQIINGHCLYEELLSKLLKLKSFHFCFIYWHYTGYSYDIKTLLPSIIDLDDIVKTYQTSYWLKQTIFFYEHDERDYFFIATLPYHYEQFNYINDNIINYRLNQSGIIATTTVRDNAGYGSQQLPTTMLLTMSKVKKIALYQDPENTKEILSLKLFQFLKQTFICATVLKLNENYYLEPNVRKEVVQLNRIEEVQYITPQIDKRILRLLPNVRRKICQY